MPGAERWLVDGFNVLHVGLLHGRERTGFWRGAERERLLARAARFDDPSAEIWVVFDGPRPAPVGSPLRPGMQVVFAPSADAWLLRSVRQARDPGALVLVTADRKLADRARHRGARVAAPRDFLERCGPPEPPEGSPPPAGA